MVLGAKKKAAAKNKTEEKSAPAASEGLPLFYKNPVPLDSKRHEKSGLQDGGDYVFAREVNSVPANLGEFALLSKFYPIIFVGEEVPMPIVVIGLDDSNVMIDDKGKWADDAYIPAYVRRYPFVLISTKEKEKFFLAIDEEAEVFTDKKPARGFYKDGKHTDLIENAMKFCQAFQADHEATEQFCKTMAKENLFRSNSVTITLADGKTKRAMAGFKTLDVEALNKLPDDKFLEIRKSGSLPFIYAHIASLDNWPRLGYYAGKQGKVLGKK